MKTEKELSSESWSHPPLKLSLNRFQKFLLLLLAISILIISDVLSREVWRVTLDPPVETFGLQIKVAPDGAFYRFYRWTEEIDHETDMSHHNLTRITPNGEIDWEINWESEPSYWDMDVDNHGNVYVSSVYGSSEGHNSFIRKYSSSGGLLFDNSYKSSSAWGEVRLSLQNIDTRGNMIFLGETRNIFNGCENTLGWIGGGAPSGALTWSKELGTLGTSTVIFVDLIGTDDYGGALFRYEEYQLNCVGEECKYIPGCVEIVDTIFIKTDINGNTVWQVTDNTPSYNKYLVAPSGNIYIRESNQVRCINLVSGTDWSITLPDPAYRVVENEPDRSTLILRGNNPSICINSDGSIRWQKALGISYFVFGPDGDIYSSTGSEIKHISSVSGDEIDSMPLPLGGRISCVDDDGAVYIHSGDSFAKYTFGDYLSIRDTHNDTIPDTEFELYKVENDPPMFTEEYLGKFTTDSKGRLEYSTEEDTISVELDEGTKYLINGDLIKVSKNVHNEPAVKHPTLIKTMFSMHLDNAKFDSMGVMSFDKFDANSTDILLDHAELRYNLVASVQWDATTEYLASLSSGFSYLSDYLYDVYDGQVRLDTVMIYDNEEHWLESDIRIFSNNTEWPRAYSGGINNGMAAWSIFFPRKFFGSGNNADDSYLEYPYELTETDNYRAMGHEFGHYAMNFFDEYFFMGNDGNFNQTDRCLSHYYEPYGYMDSPYLASGEEATELSSSFDYSNLDCRNTKQYYYHGMSCWDYFRQLFEGYYESVWVPVSVPGNAVRKLPPGLNYFPGPNNDEMAPDYYVGFKTIFPIEHTGPTAFDLDIVAHDATTLDRMGGVDVTLLKERAPGDWYSIPQGKTSTPDASGTSGGGIFVLGAETGDRIRMVSDYTIMGIAELRSAAIVEEDETDKWMYGEATVQNSNATTLSLQTVDGYFPAICDASIGEEKTDFYLYMPEILKELPAFNLSNEDKTLSSSMQVTSNGYSTTVIDNIGETGRVTYTAIDNSSNNFFFDNSYTVTNFSDAFTKEKLALGCQGLSELIADSTSGIERVMLLNSPYLVPRAGLESNSIQAGDAISVSTMPEASLENEGATFIIRYNDIDLKLADGKGVEADLSVYKWDIEQSEWTLIGGTPDTVRNMIVIHIDSPGVYAAFTNTVITGINHEFRLNPPEKFSLSQNYPNPFKQVTEIEFNLAKTSKIKLDILNLNGQLVRTLVNNALDAGTHKVDWDSRDNAGKQMPSGIYLYRLTADEFVETKSMVLLR